MTLWRCDACEVEGEPDLFITRTTGIGRLLTCPKCSGRLCVIREPSAEAHQRLVDIWADWDAWAWEETERIYREALDTEAFGPG